MQQGGGSHSHQYASAGDQYQQTSQMVVEEASPISSRPPASAAGNMDDFMAGGGSGGGYSDMDALATAAAGDDADRGGGGGGGNRWPRQETLALLKVRAEMDAAFRDATVKGPLWEDVSRKLAELGYKRSAKKCKEKFENVDKYYKRTKEGRAGRQDGKTYKFFSELEALHNTSAGSQPLPLPPTMAAAATAPSTTAAAHFAGIGFSSPMPISSVRPLHTTTSISLLPPQSSQHFPVAAGGAQQFMAGPMMGLDFSSDSSSTSPETEDDEEENEGSDPEGEPSTAAGTSRKRKRAGGGGGDIGGRGSRKMMEFFEGLMKQVVQKQEAMQQKFLEAIEKREQERLIREEAWRRQEMARLAREHEIMAQERAISASRDSSIMAILQKITGQTIQLPSAPPPAATAPAPITPTPPPPAAAPPPQPVLVAAPTQPPLPPDRPPHSRRPHQPAVASTDIVLAAVPEQQVRMQDSGSGEPPSSRWPKTEVLALIKLRSGLESRYQEAGPKGPLWEEISAGMQRMGYSRSSKRCKEKWENINKYFKKVKESNKKRPDDAKTCPYFHELDALYRKKVLGGTGTGSEGAGSSAQQSMPAADDRAAEELEAKDGINIDHGSKKPEDTVKESSAANDRQQLELPAANKADMNALFESQRRNVGLGRGAEDEEDMIMDEDDDEDDDEEDDGEEDEELQEERKMAYKIEFQQQQQNNSSSSRQNGAAGAAGRPPNGGGNGATASFMAMVQ